MNKKYVLLNEVSVPLLCSVLQSNVFWSTRVPGHVTSSVT